jgi:hypothetical protein
MLSDMTRCGVLSLRRQKCRTTIRVGVITTVAEASDDSAEKQVFAFFAAIGSREQRHNKARLGR